VLSFLVTDVDSITYSPGGPEGSAEVATFPPASVGSTGALCAGVVGEPGDSPVLARGICYSLVSLPDLSGPSVVASGVNGPFQVQLAGLQPGASYFARTFATNAQGTSYGNQVSFSTISADYLNPTLTYGSVTDQEGNSYATIVIGAQEWMAENLRTTTYANGDPIPNVTNNTTWGQLTTGAWAHYENNASYENPYGNLYNWYAVADPRNACPAGWHVPTDVEWQQLELALGVPVGELDGIGYYRGGGVENVGGEMKTAGTLYWSSPNTGATNENGFSGLPGGFRNGGFGFLYLGDVGYWWSASESTATYAWRRTLSTSFQGVQRADGTKRDGFAVRCVRD
jgi:uncharacterized protein (TIGR02145 family)